MALHVMDEANQCLGCKKPRCQQGCPIQTNIPEVIRLLKANKLDEAGRKAGIVRCCQRFLRFGSCSMILLSHKTAGIVSRFFGKTRKICE